MSAELINEQPVNLDNIPGIDIPDMSQMPTADSSASTEQVSPDKPSWVIDSKLLKPFFSAINPFFKLGSDALSSSVKLEPVNDQLKLTFSAQGFYLSYYVPLINTSNILSYTILTPIPIIRSMSLYSNTVQIFKSDAAYYISGVGTLELDNFAIKEEHFLKSVPENFDFSLQPSVFYIELKSLYPLFKLATSSENEIILLSNSTYYANFITSVLSIKSKLSTSQPLFLTKTTVETLLHLLPSTTSPVNVAITDTEVFFTCPEFTVVFPKTVVYLDEEEIKEFFSEFEPLSYSVSFNSVSLRKFLMIAKRFKPQSIDFIFSKEGVYLKVFSPTRKEYVYPLSNQAFSEDKTFSTSFELFGKLVPALASFGEVTLTFSEQTACVSWGESKLLFGLLLA